MLYKSFACILRTYIWVEYDWAVSPLSFIIIFSDALTKFASINFEKKYPMIFLVWRSITDAKSYHPSSTICIFVMSEIHFSLIIIVEKSLLSIFLRSKIWFLLWWGMNLLITIEEILSFFINCWTHLILFIPTLQ